MKDTFISSVIIFLFLGVVFFNISCEDFLEKPDSNDVTEDSIFSSALKAQTFLFETYRQLLPVGFPLKYLLNDDFQMARCLSVSLCDEAKISTGSTITNTINANGFTPSNTSAVEDKWKQNWVGIRMAYIIINRINDVPDLSEVEKEQIIAECKVMIALRYLRMFKRYGGLPLVYNRLTVNDNLEIPRSNIEETVNFIVHLCDEALESPLPDLWDSKWRGRVTKGVALSIKSETYLFAASPLFNTDVPYMATDKPGLVSYGNYDKNRWKRAAEAAQAVIDWAPTGGVNLINTGDPFDDYGTAVSKHDNSEIILAYKGNGDPADYRGFDVFYVPSLGSWVEGNNILYNFLPNFYKADGTDQEWNEQLGVKYPFSEYTRKMNELEPRFKQMAWVFDQYAYNNPTSTRFKWLYTAYNLDTKGVCKLVKFLYRYQGEVFKQWTIFRLGEFYLNLAEAWNEYSPNDAKAYDALNVIRRRAGLPEIFKEDPKYNNQDALRQLIRRERAIELYAEDHRPHDLRRWHLPLNDQYWGGPVYGFQFDKTVNSGGVVTGYSNYNLNLIENRYWNNKMYLYCFPQEEVNRGYISQNPGY